ncbi:MAG TPA: DNA gyrase subunit A, partial [Fastidiosipila sp.]|nr:DNA gyrase subunit A [Fastidiosipila sp.]
TAVVNLLQLMPGEKIEGMIPIESFDQGGSLIMATRNGLVKKTLLIDYQNIQRNGLIAINLREGDEMVGVKLAEEGSEVILVTRRGMSIRFEADMVRETGRNTMGVRGIDLRDDDEVIGMVIAEGGGSMLVVTENGFGKRSDLDDYRLQNRGGRGLITYRVSHKTGLIVDCALVSDELDVLLINDRGVIIRFSASDIPTLGRNTQGVTLMRSRDGVVVDMAIVEHEDEDEEDESPSVTEATEDAEESVEHETRTVETDVAEDDVEAKTGEETSE